MADYIDRNILCQAYVHIEPENLEEDEYDTFQAQIDHFIQARGRFFLYAEIDPTVELKDGSLKVYATLAGALYIGIGQCGSFRSGLDFLASDVKRLSESIVNECLFLSRSRQENVLRVEARLGVVGSLKSVVDDLEFIEKNMGVVSVSQLQKKLEATIEDTEKLLANLMDPKDVPFVKKNLLKVAEECLPERATTPKKKKPQPDAKALYRRNRKELISILKEQ